MSFQQPAMMKSVRNQNNVVHQTNQPLLTEIIQARRLTLFGHIARMDDNVDAKQILTSSPSVYWKILSGKGKVNRAPENVGGCSSPSSRPCAGRWRTTNVCDGWPMRRQTYGYLPSRKTSPPIDWNQIILLGDRGTRVLKTCPGLHSTAERPGFEPATY